jgi:hypothetical protein
MSFSRKRSPPSTMGISTYVPRVLSYLKHFLLADFEQCHIIVTCSEVTRMQTHHFLALNSQFSTMWAILLLMSTANAFFYAAPPTIRWVVHKQQNFFSKTTSCKATRSRCVSNTSTKLITSRSRSDHAQT